LKNYSSLASLAKYQWLPELFNFGVRGVATSVTVNGVEVAPFTETLWLTIHWDVQSSTSNTVTQGNTTTTSTNQYVTGYATGVSANISGSTNIIGPFPDAVPDLVVHNTINIQQLNLDEVGHTVFANATTLVNSSSGNDVIYNAGFVYTGSGNDSVWGNTTGAALFLRSRGEAANDKGFEMRRVG
jgi:hypothetical protein